MPLNSSTYFSDLCPAKKFMLLRFETFLPQRLSKFSLGACGALLWGCIGYAFQIPEDAVRVQLLSLTNEEGLPFFGSKAIHRRRSLVAQNLQGLELRGDDSSMQMSFTLQGFKDSDEVLSFDLPRMPSVFSENATVHINKAEEGHIEAKPAFHAPIYGNKKGALTLLSEYSFEGVLIHPTDQVYLHVRSGRQGQDLYVSTVTHEPTWLCGTTEDFRENPLFPPAHPATTVSPQLKSNGSEHVPADPIGESTNRRVLTVERWTNCFNRDDVQRQLTLGFAVGHKLVAKLKERALNTEAFVASLVASINLVYEAQLNIRLSVANVFVQQTAGGPSWNNPTTSCTLSISKQLDNFGPWVVNGAPARRGLWHLIDDCFPGAGTIGLAYIGTLCNRNGANTGVSWYSTQMWLTVAHELGHNFGAGHTFEEGQGRTGGIMDYGDGKLNGEYQFHTKYLKEEMCREINSVVDSCEHFSLASSAAVCGNGIVEVGEKCECASGTSCTCCSSCQLTIGAQCSPQDRLLGQCCSSNCTFSRPSVTCDFEGFPGFCNQGKCEQTMCDFWGNFGKFCGLNPTNPCKIRCMLSSGVCSNMEGWVTSTGQPINALTGVPCGSTGTCVPCGSTGTCVPCGSTGTCQSGACVGDTATSSTTKPPTTTTSAPWSVPVPTQAGDCLKYANTAILDRPDVVGGANGGYTFKQCDDACIASTTCRSFVYSSDDGFCALFSAVKTVQDLSAGPGQATYICSGRGVSVTGCNKWADRFFVGLPDLGSPSAEKLGLTIQQCWERMCGGYTLEACNQACQANLKCKSFTWGRQDQYCELWSNKKTYLDLLPDQTGYDTYICPERAVTTTLPPTKPPATCKSYACPDGWGLKPSPEMISCPAGCTASYCCEKVPVCQFVTCHHGGVCQEQSGECQCTGGWTGPTCLIAPTFKGTVSILVRVVLNANIDTFNVNEDIDRFVYSVLTELALQDPKKLVPAEAFTNIQVLLDSSSTSTVMLQFELVQVEDEKGNKVDPLEVARRLRDIASYTQSSFLVGMSVYSASEQLQDTDGVTDPSSAGPTTSNGKNNNNQLTLTALTPYLAIGAAGLCVVLLIALIAVLCRRNKRAEAGQPDQAIDMAGNNVTVTLAASAHHDARTTAKIVCAESYALLAANRMRCCWRDCACCVRRNPAAPPSASRSSESRMLDVAYVAANTPPREHLTPQASRSVTRHEAPPARAPSLPSVSQEHVAGSSAIPHEVELADSHVAAQSDGSAAADNRGAWEQRFDPTTGYHYYYNPQTGISSWELPVDDQGLHVSEQAFGTQTQEQQQEQPRLDNGDTDSTCASPSSVEVVTSTYQNQTPVRPPVGNAEAATSTYQTPVRPPVGNRRHPPPVNTPPPAGKRRPPPGRPGSPNTPSTGSPGYIASPSQTRPQSPEPASPYSRQWS
eukprot:g21446.t1